MMVEVSKKLGPELHEWAYYTGQATALGWLHFCLSHSRLVCRLHARRV